MLQMEKELFESKSLQLELVDQLKVMEKVLVQANDKLQAFKKDNENLRSVHGPVYIGKLQDNIDQALQNFLNENTSFDLKKLKILFIRESEGIYRFG